MLHHLLLDPFLFSFLIVLPNLLWRQLNAWTQVEASPAKHQVKPPATPTVKPSARPTAAQTVKPRATPPATPATPALSLSDLIRNQAS